MVSQPMHLLLGLEVVEEDGAFLGLLTPILDDDARAVDDLSGITVAVDLAYSNHSQNFGFSIKHIDQFQLT
jgi:hypothetical protein